VDDLNPALPVLTQNFTTVGQVAVVYLPSLRQTLVLLPPGVAHYQAALLPYAKSRAVLLDFKLNVNNPEACTDGFTPKAQWRDPGVTTTRAVPAGMFCKLPHDSSIDVRGAHNYPCVRYPGHRAGTIDLCSEEATGHAQAAPPVAYLPGSVDVTTYQPRTGRFVAPDGELYALGLGTSGPPAKDWQALLVSTLGR